MQEVRNTLMASFSGGVGGVVSGRLPHCGMPLPNIHGSTKNHTITFFLLM